MIKKDTKVSFHRTEKSLLKDMFSLWFRDGIEADFTYSKGIMWKHLVEEKKPSKRFDIEPKDKMTTWADIGKRIPLKNNSIKSGIFDPPFVIKRPVKNPKNLGIIAGRFASFKDINTLWNFHKNAIEEIYRVLKPGGRVIVKIQDITDRRSRFSSNEMYNFAVNIGFAPVDKFQLVKKARLPLAATVKVQKHARKVLVDYYVFEKPKRKYRHPEISVLSRKGGD